MNFYTTQNQTAVICLFPAKITLWREMSEFRVKTSDARWKRKLYIYIYKRRLNLLGINFYTTQKQTAVICLFPAKITLWREMSEFRVKTSYARWKRKLYLQ